MRTVYLLGITDLPAQDALFEALGQDVSLIVARDTRPDAGVLSAVDAVVIGLGDNVAHLSEFVLSASYARQEGAFVFVVNESGQDISGGLLFDLCHCYRENLDEGIEALRTWLRTGSTI